MGEGIPILGDLTGANQAAAARKQAQLAVDAQRKELQRQEQEARLTAEREGRKQAALMSMQRKMLGNVPRADVFAGQFKTTLGQ